MANMNWSKMDVDTQNTHVRHPPHWKVSHFWHGQNVPKTQAYQPPRTQGNRAKPPGLLRLNSVGEAVEESSHLCQNRRQFCAASARPPKQSNHQQHNSYFLGNFWNKVREPLRTRQNLARTVRSPQEDIDLDHLVEKFAFNSVNCEMDPQKFQPNMGQQEIDQRPVSTVVPVMTFNGGPYIKCASKDNTSPRTFPAYYRFLNLAHFHPYNNTSRNRTHAVPPFQQQPFRTGAWSGITQRQPLSDNKEACHHRPINQGASLFTSTNHVKKTCNGRMMQNNCTMSHQKHQYSARATKPTSSPHETETKWGFCKFKHRLKTTQSNAAFVNNGTSVHLLKKSSKDLEVESPPCEKTCVTLSQCGLSETDTKTNSNTSQDKSPNQQGHVDSSQTNIACEESDCFCSSEETAKHFELKIVECNNESDGQQTREEVDSKEQTENAAKQIEVAKEMHSSIAFLLGDYMNSTPTCSTDSDFSDVDEEDLDDNKRELLDSFLPADNPLYVWKCLSKSEDISNSSEIENTTDKTLTFNDSGTVLGQTSDEATSSNSQSDESDVADSDSDPSDESSDSGCDEEEGMSDLLNRTNDPYDPMGGRLLQPSSSLTVSKGTSTESSEKGLALHSESKEAAALKLCPQRHPSVSFILGLDSSDGDTPDVSDAEDSDDFENATADYDKLWQSFELPRDPYNPINGCKFRSPFSIPKSASSSAELTSPKSSHPDLETDAVQQTPQHLTCSSDSLKQSSSIGCLKKAINPDKERVKKVSFCSKEPAIISPEVNIWEEEYVEARRGQWEEFARDRCRFQRRIRQAEFTITPCLRPEHRVKVFLKLNSL